MLNTSLNMEQSLRLDASTAMLLEIVTMPLSDLETKIREEADINPVIKLSDNELPFSDTISQKGERKTTIDEANSSFYTSDDEKDDWFERTVSKSETLEEHLLSELGCLSLTPEVRETAEIIISGLDDYGFTGPNPILLVPEENKSYVPEALKVIKSLEPTGVGAEDWKEAVMLQIKEKEKNKEELKLYYDILYHGLDYIRDNKKEQLSKALRISQEDLEGLLDVIAHTSPFPGLKYSSADINYAIPELSIRVKDDEIVMKVLKGNLPSFTLDENYEEMRSTLKGKKDAKEKEALKYLNEKISTAENLKKMISYRENTLERIGIILTTRQKDFFFKGPMYLKGLTMKETAEEVGISISTISKMANSKYIDTDWGILSLRSFFTSEVKTEDGEGLSKEAVKLKIQKIIDENTSGKNLSDQKISDRLKEEGITVARRTVSKYRQEMKNKA